MGKLAPAKSRPDIIQKNNTQHGCDSCGVSQIDGKRIAAAKYEVKVPGGSLFFCGNHMRKNFAHILEKDYDVINLEVDTVAG